MARPLRALLAALFLLLMCLPSRAAEPLKIGSKRFTESYILAEILAQSAAPHGPVELRQGLGNTAVVLAALRAGSIDVYPEYLGTIELEILKNPRPGVELAALNAQLAPLGLAAAVPLGFSNGYALALRGERARALGIATLGELARHPELRLGLSNEFIGRADGWPGLARRYGLPQRPTGLDHGLAYQALAQGQVDVIDIYTTDAQIGRQGLRPLRDEAGHFPRYDALLLYRLDLPRRHPAAWAALQRLAGSIDADAMIAMNARAELDGIGFATIAREHLGGARPAAASPPRGFVAKLLGPDLARLGAQHLALVLAAVGLAVLVGVPLAVAVAPHPGPRAFVLGLTGVLQTVPSLALLAALISLLGRIGALPALLALSLYALLPVMRNTCVGLAEVPAGLKLAGAALGLSARQRLALIELPLALPTLVAGVRTAASIAVGTATIAAFIGAGGYGERIVTGLALNDHELLLAGALPAAALALLIEGLFALLERRLRRRTGRA